MPDKRKKFFGKPAPYGAGIYRSVKNNAPK